jgi:uncharacterized membrane protein
MINLTLYYRKNSDLCDKAIQNLEEIKKDSAVNVLLIDIAEDLDLYKKIYDSVPVVEVGPYRLEKDFNMQQLRVAIGAAQDRVTHLEQIGDAGYQKKVQKGKTVTGTDRFSYWFSNHYMLAFNFLVLLYVGLPFLAPVFMKIGAIQPAKVIYTIYSPLCHQLAFRSFFLFGEQTAYPRAMAHVPGLMTYEQLTGTTQLNLIDARNFIGNAIAGYKVAFCERDVAIYGAILLFGILFSLSGKKFKPIRWYWWVIFGIIPIGIDGVSQLPSLAANLFPAWVPIRESTPFLRVLTGGLFGFFTAWYLYPLIEETMLETRKILHKKIVLQETLSKGSPTIQ